MPIASLIERHPQTAAVACAALQFAVTAALLIGGAAALPPSAFGAVKLAAFASTVLVPLALLTLPGVWSRLGLGWRELRPRPVFLASLIPVALLLAAGLHQGNYAAGGNVLGEIGVQLVNAFGEELLFRGVIFALLWRLPVWRGIVVSGVLFGSMHLLHGFMGAGWDAAFSQAAVTAIAGMMFAAVRYATGSLWLVILLHTVINLATIYSNVGPAWGETAYEAVQRLGVLVEVVVTLYVASRAWPQRR
jgi:membrane protease YdiL (CAAX protease family)